ncbi:MAG: hypothetical protein ACR2MM_05240 [Flavobacteriaceae bacterium]
MKKFFKYSVYSTLLILALTFTSCQEEFEPLSDPNEQETILASSSTAKLIENTSSRDGSFDNIVDGASCFDLKFPYVVNVNGEELTIDSEEALQLIENIFDAIEDDENLLEIIFPVTVTLSDYAEVTINNLDELRELAKECIEGGDDDDIECIDFKYPITLYTFDINEAITGTVVVESDEDLRKFFAGLEEDDLISIDFPVTLINYEGEEIVVDSNAELANAIERAKEACDEDDDNDYNDDDFEDDRLDICLTACPWVVKEVERDAVNLTDQYFEYLMNFSEDGSVTVKDREGNMITGEWSTRHTDMGTKLTLEFDVLVDFTLEWFVYEVGPHTIKLYSEGGNRIIMKQICVDDEVGPDTLREILRECSWIIKKVFNQGEEIERLIGYEFNFLPEGVATLSNEEITYQGSWAIIMNEEGRLVLDITFGDEPAVNFQWPLRELTNKRLKFEIEEIGYELVLQRVCENDEDGDILEIRNILFGGEWMVALFEQGDMNITENFAGYSFDFDPEHIVGATLGETGPTQLGMWRVIRNSEGKLKVYLNFGDGAPLGDLTDDWEFVSINEGRLELKSIREDNATGTAYIETLVFEKL